MSQEQIIPDTFFVINDTTKVVDTWSGSQAYQWALSGEMGVNLYEGEVVTGYDGILYAKGNAPIPNLGDVKSAKILEIDFIANQKIVAGFWYEDTTIMTQPLHFSFGIEDQANFSSAMNGANLFLISQAAGQDMGIPSTIAWNGYKDVEHKELVAITFNATQFIQFWGYAETVHKNELLTQGRTYKKQINQASTVEAVNAIVWE